MVQDGGMQEKAIFPLGPLLFTLYGKSIPPTYSNGTVNYSYDHI